jgi:signal transduction histidine kinase
MTQGTSPRLGGSPSIRWAATTSTIGEVVLRLRARVPHVPLEGAALARVAAALYLGGLCIILTTAWHDPGINTAGLIAGLPGWHLGFLMATGATAALLTLMGRPPHDGTEPGGEAPIAATRGLSELMAQMNHELRTPLNAVIGFSEVMLRELHGPLGNARYQEYAHHISESGGRLLKSSEEALAITEAMTALMADRLRAKRVRLLAGPLVRDAWRAATPNAGTPPRLILTTCNTCDIVCEHRPTAQALEHLLREAVARAPAGSAVEVIGQRQGGKRSLEITIQTGSEPLGSSLRVILARLLLETQGATLTCTNGEAGHWSALIELPGRAA